MKYDHGGVPSRCISTKCFRPYILPIVDIAESNCTSCLYIDENDCADSPSGFVAQLFATRSSPWPCREGECCNLHRAESVSSWKDDTHDQQTLLYYNHGSAPYLTRHSNPSRRCGSGKLKTDEKEETKRYDDEVK